MLKKSFIVFFVFLLFISFQSSAGADTSSKIDKLDSKADEALRLVTIKRYKEAEHLLNKFSDELLEWTAEGDTMNMDQLRATLSAHEEAVKSVNNEAHTYEQKVKSVTKFRLVVDAVKSQKDPLWTHMEDRMIETFAQVRKAVNEQNQQYYYSRMNELLSQYDLIYYSLRVDLGEEAIHTLNARFEYLDQYSPVIFENPGSQREIDHLMYDMEKIFEGKKEDEADPSLWWVIISTGSIIIGTLSYVGWRKYKGDKKELQKKENLND